MERSADKFFPRDHPCASGHFPGNPIIPGAVLLEAVLAALQKDAGQEGQHGTRYTLDSAKFLHPVRPGDRIEIRWRRAAQGTTRFECRLDGRAVLSGSITQEGP